jgi:hypothetical protein
MKTFNAENVRELELYAENTSEIYEQKKSIIKNLARKIERKVYNPTLAPKLWRYWVDEAAKRYTREFGTQGDFIFSVADRNEVSRLIAEQEYDLIKNGEYSIMIGKVA